VCSLAHTLFIFAVTAREKTQVFLLLQRLKIHSENFNSLHLPLPAEALSICLTGLYDTDRFALERMQIRVQETLDFCLLKTRI
jgi:hypothetical protein